MEEKTTGGEEMRQMLKNYLAQYYQSRCKKRQLEQRLRTFREDMVGTKGMQYSPVPRSQTNKVGEGPASMVIRAMEIEEQIDDQKAEMAKAMLNVMKLMDYLPKTSMERIILEYRHIDCLNWKQVCKETNYSRASCNNYYNAGLDKLLGYKKVRKLLNEFKAAQNPSTP